MKMSQLNNRSEDAAKADKITGAAATLSFHEVGYKVQVGNCCRKIANVILRDVSGVFEPGLNAIMGPTGGGKTSLLDLLAGRRESEGLQGDILFNGKTLPSDFKLISGYVTQDDIIMGTLTVRENLQFAANMRLRNCSKEEKLERVNEIIQDLGLDKCQHTKVGTVMIQGVSGGEKKRCNIGIELVTKPQVLFLDEPTTGLDASTSHSVMNLLRDLTVQGNRTIVFSIHQPRYSIFRLFDRLHLLSSHGQTVFHGPASQAVDYFARHNLVCETYNNPADFFLDVITQNSESSDLKINLSDSVVPIIETCNSNGKAAQIDLPALFKTSPENRLMKKVCFEILDHRTISDNCRSLGYPINWFSQFFYLSQRSIRNLLREKQRSIVPSASMAILALVVGSLYLDVATDLNGFQNLFGALFFVSIQMLFGNVPAIQAFITGRNIFLHESANGFYRVSAYFVATVFCDLLPLRTVPSLVFGTIFYWIIGLKFNLKLFAFFHLTNIVTTMSACSLAFFISVASGSSTVANALLAVIFVIMMLFSGLILNVSSMPVALSWLQYTSISRFCLVAHAGAQISDLEFCGYRTIIRNGTAHEDYFCEPGKELLRLQDINYDTASQWLNVGFLLIYTVTFFTLAYLSLRMVRKNK